MIVFVTASVGSREEDLSETSRDVVTVFSGGDLPEE